MVTTNESNQQGVKAPRGGNGLLQAVSKKLQPTIDQNTTEPNNDPAAVTATEVRYLPLDGFNNQVQEYINDTADAIGCNAASVAISCITTASAAISGKRTARLLTKNQKAVKFPLIVPNIFGCIVARAGVGKTPAIKLPLRRLEELDRELKQSYLFEVGQYNQTKGNTQAPPKRKKRIVGNATVEGIVAVAQGNSDDLGNMQLPVYMVLDELGGFFKNISSSKFTDGKDFFCNAFDGHATNFVRKTDGITDFDNLKVSFIGGIQPEVLRARITADPDLVNQGFLHRFLWVFDESEIQDTSEKGENENARNYWQTTVESLTKLGETDRPLEFSKDATALYWRWYSNFVKFTREQNDGRVDTLFSKQQMQLCRLALVFAVLHQQDRIEKDDVQAAIKCCNYFLHTALKTFDYIETGEISTNYDQATIVNLLSKRCVAKGGKINLTMLSRSLSQSDNWAGVKLAQYKRQHGEKEQGTDDKGKGA